MGKREEQRKMKLCVLTKIKDKKRLLFGAFSEKLTKEDKVRAWKEINSYAQSIGVIPSSREWSYLRDVWWPNVRKTATEKIDNAKCTGTAGGKDKTISDVDEEVLLIIGKDSPAIVGLDVPESMNVAVTNGNVCNHPSPSSIQCSNAEVVQAPTAPSPPVIPSTSRGLPSSNTQPLCMQRAENTSDKLDEGDEKKKLQIELLKIQIYKSKLESRKLEIELGLPNSTYTTDIAEDIY